MRIAGLIALNVMRAVSDYAAQVRQALRSGIDAIVMGAGLPLDLPELTADHPEVALVPILSDARGVQVVLRKWERKKRVPNAIVLEHPAFAGGHLGAASVEDVHDPRFDFERSVPETRALLRAAGIEASTPVIVAGGIRSRADIARLQGLGAAGVQLGTPFAVTVEGDAHPDFKRVLAEAREEDKPADVIERIVEGQLTKWAKEVTLLDQEHVRTDRYEGQSIEDLRAGLASKTGENVRVARFARFVVGEAE